MFKVKGKGIKVIDEDKFIITYEINTEKIAVKNEQQT